MDIRIKREPIEITNNDIEEQKKQILDKRKLIFAFKENVEKTAEYERNKK